MKNWNSKSWTGWALTNLKLVVRLSVRHCWIMFWVCTTWARPFNGRCIPDGENLFNRITGTPPHREIEKTALAQPGLWQQYVEKPETIVSTTKNSSHRIIAIRQTTQSKPKILILKGENSIWFFGNEIHGVSDAVIDLCDAAIEIRSGRKHS